MVQPRLDLEHPRTALELSVQRANARAHHLAALHAPRATLVEAQDELSDAVANLAGYLLATGEPGGIGGPALPPPGPPATAELRRM